MVINPIRGLPINFYNTISNLQYTNPFIFYFAYRCFFVCPELYEAENRIEYLLFVLSDMEVIISELQKRLVTPSYLSSQWIFFEFVVLTCIVKYQWLHIHSLSDTALPLSLSLCIYLWSLQTRPYMSFTFHSYLFSNFFLPLHLWQLKFFVLLHHLFDCWQPFSCFLLRSYRSCYVSRCK